MAPFKPTLKKIPGLTDLKPLGRGGMAEVYRAVRKSDGRAVAVKVLTEDAMLSPTNVQRFEREAETMGALRHPHIVQAYAFGEVDGRPYLLMELVEGPSAQDKVLADGPLPADEALYLVEQTAAALAYAHEQGFIHRDVKPSNILLAEGRSVKLSDFGLAKLEGDMSVTIDGSVLGTPHYLAPEQISGSPNIDARADIYSLGMTLYFLVAGRPAFAGSVLHTVLTRHLTDRVAFDDELRARLSEPLMTTIRRMTAKRPEQRYASIAELRRDLAWIKGEADEPARPSNDLRADAPEFYVQDWTRADAAGCDDDRGPCHEMPDDPAHALRLAPGDVLCYEGEACPDVHWLLSGEIEVLRAGRRVAVIRETGTILGEIAALRRAPRQVTMRALSPTALLRVGAEEFPDYLAAHPSALREVLRELAERAFHAGEKLSDAEAALADLRRTVLTIAQGLAEHDLTAAEGAALLNELMMFPKTGMTE